MVGVSETRDYKLSFGYGVWEVFYREESSKWTPESGGRVLRIATLIHTLCFFGFQDHLIFSHFTSNIHVKSQKTTHRHGQRAATSPPIGSGRTTSYSTSAAALASGMPSTTISDCSCCCKPCTAYTHTTSSNATFVDIMALQHCSGVDDCGCVSVHRPS